MCPELIENFVVRRYQAKLLLNLFSQDTVVKKGQSKVLKKIFASFVKTVRLLQNDYTDGSFF